jgi:hypothetical protein
MDMNTYKNDSIDHHDVVEDYEMLMKDYDMSDSNGYTRGTWRLIGDFFEQFSLYDTTQQSISSNNLIAQ